MKQQQAFNAVAMLAVASLLANCTAVTWSETEEGKGPRKVGEVLSADLVSPANPLPNERGVSEIVWREEIVHHNATYLAVHFAAFDLPRGAELMVRAADSSREVLYKGIGKHVPGAKGFWATHMPGEHLVLELKSSVALDAGAVRIDRLAKGLPAYNELTDEISSGLSAESICGADDSREAKCFQSSEPEAYNKSRAVIRMITNGIGGCTAWLVGSEGHVMTNQHCIDSQSDAANTDFEFLAEGADCTVDCRRRGGCPGVIEASGATLVKVRQSLDYALLKLPNNPSTKYGFLQLRRSGAITGERIYIAGHPRTWGKRISMRAGNENARVTTKNTRACVGGGRDVGYLADTQGGSSGSPVLAYADHQVIALHHCGGCPNKGVPIENIVADLEATGDLPNNAVAGSGGNPTPTPPVGEVARFFSSISTIACEPATNRCDSGTALIRGRGTIGNGAEQNRPNTLDGCSDGNRGSFHQDESIDRIVVESGNGQAFTAGLDVQVRVTAFAFRNGEDNTLDIFYTRDARNPSWALVDSLPAERGGLQTLQTTFSLQSGATFQGIRAQWRYQGSAVPCAQADFNDRDDLVIRVGNG